MQSCTLGVTAPGVLFIFIMEENKMDEKKYTFENPEYRHTYWHSCSHVLAQAVKLHNHQLKLAIGPAIDNGI